MHERLKVDNVDWQWLRLPSPHGITQLQSARLLAVVSQQESGAGIRINLKELPIEEERVDCTRHRVHCRQFVHVSLTAALLGVLVRLVGPLVVSFV